MSDKTAIAWTDATWNPVSGCSKVSPGCAHCYISRTPPFRMEGRDFERRIVVRNTRAYGEMTTGVRLHPERLDAPLHWRKPRRIFVCSMADLFHEAVGYAFVDEVFRVMWKTPQHTYQVLTKRPERMLRYLRTYPSLPRRKRYLDDKDFRDATWGDKSPLPNVWLGVSAENQRWADARIPLLLQTPAAVRFVSAEPLLSHIVFEREWLDRKWRPVFGGPGDPVTEQSRPVIDWIIVGGESGPKYRPMNWHWAETLREQCRAAGVAYFGKQDSGPRPGIPLPGELGAQEWPQ